MNSSVFKLVAVCLLLLCIVSPRPNTATPPPLLSKSQGQAFAWGPALRQKLDEKAFREAAFYAEMAKKAKRPTRRASGGGDVAVSGDVFWSLALCESGGTNASTGNGFYGYFQFVPATFNSLGFDGLPTEYGYDAQREAAQRLQARSGWGQWPACSRKLGLR